MCGNIRMLAVQASSIMYASVAQLDRSFGSDNCDRAGFWLVFVRYSVICVCKNAVVNGSQTTN